MKREYSTHDLIARVSANIELSIALVSALKYASEAIANS